MPAQPSEPRSNHFHIERLADGVYAAIAADFGGAIANAGIVDLADSALSPAGVTWGASAARGSAGL